MPNTFEKESSLARPQRHQDCIAAAAASTTDRYVPLAGQRIYVFTSPRVDVGGYENVGAIGGDKTALPEIAHEFGHGVGLNRSWSNDVTWKDASWAGGGEYDNKWDLMSAGNIYDPTGAFDGGPPDLERPKNATLEVPTPAYRGMSGAKRGLAIMFARLLLRDRKRKTQWSGDPASLESLCGSALDA